ncbi:hypothetical protein EQH57_0487 [Dictyocoela roeselum]|nr:hypothetical protein EQH57_0487 [Dictyocoela roeselum]
MKEFKKKLTLSKKNKPGRYNEKFERFILHKHDRIFITKENNESFLKYMHEILIHPGENKLYYAIRRFFFVREMKSTIKNVTKQCFTCCKCKNRTIRYGKVSGGISAHSFLEVIYSDFFGTH